MVVATTLELLHRVFCPWKEPSLTRYSVGLLAKSLTLNIESARRDLGYTPRISIDQGLERTCEWLRLNHLSR